MQELKFEPIGRVKMSKSRYWKIRAFRLKRMMLGVSIVMFLFGVIVGFIIR